MTNSGTIVDEYPRPALTVDTVVWTVRAGRLCVLLIERAREPFAGRWALPGGFVDKGERLRDAARRELAEETGLAAKELWTVGTFGDPGRDPRGWTVSAVYYTVIANDETKRLTAGDDAAKARWHAVHRLPPLAFDHREILKDAIRRLRREIYCLPVVRPLLCRSFSSAQLAAAYRLLDPKSPGARVLASRLFAAGVIADDRHNPIGENRFRFLATRAS